MRKRYLALIPLAEARERFLKACGELGVLAPREEEVHARDALGRVASREVRARRPLPPAPCAAMDGYAVRSADTFGAKPSSPVSLESGAFLPVDTGDPIPPPYDAVVPVEEADVVPGGIEVRRAVTPGHHVRAAGEDYPEGATVVPAGGIFTPEAVAACLATGNETVWVKRRPRLLFIPTGSELVPPGAPLGEGEVYETNSIIFRAYVELWGGEAVIHPIVPDEPGLLERALRGALEGDHDLICICAGSSKGRGDHTPGLLSRLGEILFHGVAMAPGKPSLFGIVAGRPVLGLPGYPVSLWVSVVQFLRPLFEAYYGVPLARGARVEGVLTRRVRSPLGIREFVRVKVEGGADGVTVTPLPGGSSRLSTLVSADGILEVPEEVEFIPKGEAVEAELIPRPW
ncbi:MAG: molybdopterin molybdenumtransferase MoeA [Caldiserica bacterium]|nr:molybdopterin molybdenumtransferase MoeA [Caldisericota bacterium]